VAFSEDALGVIEIEVLQRVRGVNGANASPLEWEALGDIETQDIVGPSDQVAGL
jgi:hypothetical protein